MTDDEILLLIEKVLTDHRYVWRSELRECYCGHPGGPAHQTQMLADSGLLRLASDEPREVIEPDTAWLRVPTSIGRQFAERILAEVDRDAP